MGAGALARASREGLDNANLSTENNMIVTLNSAEGRAPL